MKEVFVVKYGNWYYDGVSFSALTVNTSMKFDSYDDAKQLIVLLADDKSSWRNCLLSIEKFFKIC